VPKVSVVGAGNVGATVANEIARLNIADVMMVDVVEGFSLGKALDMAQAAPILGYSVLPGGRDGFAAIECSDVVVVTAGMRRKPGMDRAQLLAANAGIVRGICKEIKHLAPDSVLVLVTNPLDAMCYVAMRETGFPRERVIGMAGVLDSARMACFVAMELAITPADVRAMVLGGHGDTMVPLPRFTTVNGVPITELIPPDRIDKIVQRTRDGGAEIVDLLKTLSAFYAPGAGAAQMVEAIVTGRSRLLPASVWAQGEYGIKDTFVGLPVIIGQGGLIKIVELKLSAPEQAALAKSAGAVRSIIAGL
jgi:malate dehydrogenase